MERRYGKIHCECTFAGQSREKRKRRKQKRLKRNPPLLKLRRTRKMKKKKKKNPTKKSHRAIIYDIKNGKPYFLILHRSLRWRGWEFLKETIEKGETSRQTLIRGIQEETGLKSFKIIKRLGEQA